MSGSLGFIWRQWGSSWRVLRKEVIQSDLHYRKDTCAAVLETRWEGSKRGVKEAAAVQSVTALALRAAFVWKLTKQLPLGIAPSQAWQAWSFRSQSEAIRIRAAWWPPGPELSLPPAPSPVVCSERCRYHFSKTGSFWVSLAVMKRQLSSKARTALCSGPSLALFCSGPSLILSSHSDQWVDYVA